MNPQTIHEDCANQSHDAYAATELVQPSPQEKKHWLFLVLFSIVVGVVSISLILFFLTQYKIVSIDSESDTFEQTSESIDPAWKTHVDKTFLVQFDIPADWELETVRHLRSSHYHPAYVRTYSPDVLLQQPKSCTGETSIKCLQQTSPVQGTVIQYYVSYVGNEREQSKFSEGINQTCIENEDRLRCQNIRLGDFDAVRVSQRNDPNSGANTFVIKLGEYNLTFDVIFSDQDHDGDNSVAEELLNRFISSFSFVEGTDIQKELSYRKFIVNLDTNPFITAEHDPLRTEKEFCEDLTERARELGSSEDFKCAGNGFAWAVEVPFHGATFCIDYTKNLETIGSFIEGVACVPHEYRILSEDPDYYEFYYSVVRPFFIKTATFLSSRNHRLPSNFCGTVETNFNLALNDAARATSSVSCIKNGDDFSIELQYKELYNCIDSRGWLGTWSGTSSQNGTECIKDAGYPYKSSEDIFYFETVELE